MTFPELKSLVRSHTGADLWAVPQCWTIVPLTADVVNARDNLTLSLLQARLIDLKLPMSIAWGT